MKRRQYSTFDLNNPEKIENLFNKLKNNFRGREYFNLSDVTHNNICGFTHIDALKPFIDKLVAEGKLNKGDKKSRFSIPFELEDIESFNEDTFTEDYRSDLEEEIKKYKTFVITTAVVGKEVNEPFLNSIKNYAKQNNALVLVLPSDIVNSTNEKVKKLELDPKLSNFKVVYKDIYLNNNLCLCTIKTSAKQIKTLTGLDRISTKKQASIILASTKQFLDYVPNRKLDIPFAVMTTGAITVNNYDTDKYMSKRTAYVAENDHMYGAIVVEIEDDSKFHFRNVVATEEGYFTDLSKEYRPDGTVVELNGTVLVMGDSHTEMLDKELHDAVMDMASDMNVETLVVHDIFNGTSISHHDNGKLLTKGMKAIAGRLSLETECEGVKRYLEILSNNVKNVVIVSSNHDRHLDRFLDEGRFMSDPINLKISLRLANAFMENKNPLQYMIETVLGFSKKNVKWLKRDESYLKYGIELGNHGDEGVNGAKGSLGAFEKGLWNCVTAHTHSAKIIRNSCSVGTMSNLDMEYNHGLSNWTHTCALCYNNGTKQLINFIKNKKGIYKYGNRSY